MPVLTFASVSYLTGFILTGLCSLFLLIRKEKLETTAHLGWVFLYGSLLELSYLIGTSFFHPLAFLHRWVSLPAAFLLFAHLGSYFFLLKPQVSLRNGRIFLGAGYVLALSVLIFHVVGTIFSHPVYDFSGWTFDIISRPDEKVLAGVGIFYLFGILIFGAWRAFQAHRSDIKLLALGLWMPFVLLLGTTILFHSKEIAFPIDRAIALSFWNPVFLVALFLAWFVHLRASGEAFSLRFPFLLGIVLLLLLVFLGSSWLFLQPSLESFRNTVEERQKAEDLPIGSYTLSVQENGGFVLTTSGGLDSSPFAEAKRELILSFLWENPNLIAKEFPAYSKLGESLKGSEQYSENLIGFSKGLERLRKKVKNLPEKNLRENILDSLITDESDPNLIHFLRVVSGTVRNSSAEGESLRALVVDQIRELVPEGEPRFRRIPGVFGEYYYSIIHKSPGKTQAREIGIPLGDYLKFQTGLLRKPLLAFLLCLILFGLCANGFLSFFLLRPLERLYSGLELVTEGDLNRELHPEAWDEIGSLADQFNRMIESIRSGGESESWENSVDPEDRKSSFSFKEILSRINSSDSTLELKSIVSELRNLPNSNPQRSKLIVKAALKAKDYESAYSAAEELRSSGSVADPELLFVLSYCAKKKGDAITAIRLAEELRKILPRHSQNRLHLAEMYYHSGRFAEAQDMAVEIRMEEGASPAVSKLLNAIEKKNA
ncbi:HAMP domain-containing protein [Leptospira wolffii]|uniref:HAMP domain-containing protein n=1 Tax=Leptospira wolffii TaxID=409998 RepID=UPI0003532881|nr:HAMP domain-containing protein [Leptospira wolffii]EPG65227.1 HAMP domain protein [Leptospira wolffii serovar Khorat str. Khorat-H2]